MHVNGSTAAFIASGMFIPESDDIAATEPQSDGSTLMLLNADKASGNVQCGSSVALWSLAGGSGDRVFDGRDQNGVKNTRISGYFSSDPSKKVSEQQGDKPSSETRNSVITLSTQTTHGVLKTNAIGADLIVQCAPGSTSALDGAAVRDVRGQLEGRETLADVCGQKGKRCIRISSNMFMPDTESFAGSEKQPDGSILLLVDNAGGSGRAQCGNDIAHWSFAAAGGEKVYDGRSLNGDHNERIRGSFTSDPNKSVSR